MRTHQDSPTSASHKFHPTDPASFSTERGARQPAGARLQGWVWTAGHLAPTLVAVGVALAALLLYWPTLRLPLIYDTLLHIRIAGSLDWATVWLPTEKFGFYRPTTFTPLLAVRALWGHYPPPLLHAMNVAQHALNAALVSVLVWRLAGGAGNGTQIAQIKGMNADKAWGSQVWVALFAGLLFALFPFSYQAVVVYGHHVHPAITGLILAGLLLYQHLYWGKTAPKHRRFYLAGLLLVFVAALLTHESAILLGPLAGLMTLLYTPWRWKRLQAAVWMSVAAVGYFVAYQFFPISRAPQAAADSAGFRQTLFYFGQAASYPFTWWAHRLASVSAETLISIALLLTLILALIAWRRWRPLLFGWGWWLAASLLIALPLPADYILHGPRLLYLGSVGAAIGWATMLTRGGKIGRWLGAALLLGVLATNVSFVRGRLAAYERLTDGASLLARGTNEKTERVIWINQPQWTAPVRNTFATGAELVAQLGDYLFMGEWVAANGGGLQAAQARRVDALLADTGFAYQIHEENSAEPLDFNILSGQSDLFITRFNSGTLDHQWLGRVLPQPASDQPLLAAFDAYQLHSARAIYCNDQVDIVLEWSTNGAEIGTSISTFAQLFDENSQVIGQIDQPPLMLPPDQIKIPANYLILDHRTIDVSAQPIKLGVGVYDFFTGERQEATMNGAIFPDNTVQIEIAQCVFD